MDHHCYYEFWDCRVRDHVGIVFSSEYQAREFIRENGIFPLMYEKISLRRAHITWHSDGREFSHIGEFAYHRGWICVQFGRSRWCRKASQGNHTEHSMCFVLPDTTYRITYLDRPSAIQGTRMSYSMKFGVGIND